MCSLPWKRWTRSGILGSSLLQFSRSTPFLLSLQWGCRISLDCQLYDGWSKPKIDPELDFYLVVLLLFSPSPSGLPCQDWSVGSHQDHGGDRGQCSPSYFLIPSSRLKDLKIQIGHVPYSSIVIAFLLSVSQVLRHQLLYMLLVPYFK